MSERPILFSAQMVRALLAGKKTQTRRHVKLPNTYPLGEWEPITIGGPDGERTASGEPIPEQGGLWHDRTGDGLLSPYGQPGDRLWVREAHWMDRRDATLAVMNVDGYVVARNGCETGQISNPADLGLHPFWKLRSSIHMHRWASRITLEITGVRVERLQDISIEDAKAEGAWPDVSVVEACANYFGIGVLNANPRLAFQMLWESINGRDGWAANPWVWVVEFKRVEGST